jgi:RimJ/RimL family protein N-acetyltransferase
MYGMGPVELSLFPRGVSHVRGQGLQIELRGVEQSDLPRFFDFQRDPEGARLAAFQPRDEGAFYSHWSRLLREPSFTLRTILADGKVVGNILAFDSDGSREVGYWIDRGCWGRGIATKALTKFLAIEPVRPLHAWVATHNPASVRVLERCGFERTGRAEADTGLEGFILA